MHDAHEPRHARAPARRGRRRLAAGLALAGLAALSLALLGCLHPLHPGRHRGKVHRAPAHPPAHGLHGPPGHAKPHAPPGRWGRGAPPGHSRPRAHRRRLDRLEDEHRRERYRRHDPAHHHD